VPADVVQRADVRVGQRRDGPGFALEALTELGIGCERFGQDLDGDGAIQPRVARPIDLSHSAGANGRLDLVRAEAGAGGQGHGQIFRYAGGAILSVRPERRKPQSTPAPDARDAVAEPQELASASGSTHFRSRKRERRVDSWRS